MSEAETPMDALAETAAEQRAPRPVTIELPAFSMVLLVGVSGSGKSSFARKHFLPTEVLNSDAFRGWVCDDENSLEATKDAFDALHYVAGVRLRRRKLTVIDATNVQAESRKPLLALAAEHDALAVAIVLDLPERVCEDRNRQRTDRAGMGNHVIRNQARQLRQSMRSLRREGFRHVYVLDGEAQIEAARVVRRPLWTDRTAETGPFDIIGDVHGCLDELEELLGTLGYVRDGDEAAYTHPEGRRAIFLGDIVDRGPRVVETVRLVMAMVEAGSALAVPGNHDAKFARWLRGQTVSVTHGLEASIAQTEALPAEEREAFKPAAAKFLGDLVSHYLLDGGNLVVAHAGMKEGYQGRASGRIREFALYGDATGEIDEFGLPVRYPWAEDYRGKATVAYGHTPVPEAEWLNRTIDIDTGCVFGGKLTALRYPERELVSVPARATYCVPKKPLLPEEEAKPEAAPLSAQWQADTLLHAEDVLGKRIIETQLAARVTITADRSAAAFEVMSRYAVEPRWLVYLPPTMSPSETTAEEGYLEYPREAFAYYRSRGVPSVVCQTKHMGSRAVIVVCRDEEGARTRFGALDGAIGECYTRTGRRFFDDAETHRAFLAEVAGAVTRAGLWDELETGWLCLDAELMPWSAKAQGLLREQYAPVGVAARVSLGAARATVEAALARPEGIKEGAGTLQALAAALASREQDAAGYVRAYGHYCWPVDGLADLKLAPFHLLATEGRTHHDKPHAWHLETLAKLADHSDLIVRTESRTVDLLDEQSEAAATQWWLDYTGGGGEGMVVKPASFVARGERGLLQPAVKVRGREYLRIIYGLSYTEPANLERLRQRGLNTKRALALKEFALGLEALDHFVRREPLRRVHECVFGVLALESEPVDPRL